MGALVMCFSFVLSIGIAAVCVIGAPPTLTYTKVMLEHESTARDEMLQDLGGTHWRNAEPDYRSVGYRNWSLQTVVVQYDAESMREW